MRLGNAFEYILDSLVSVAATEALKYTVLAGWAMLKIVNTIHVLKNFERFW